MDNHDNSSQSSDENYSDSDSFSYYNNNHDSDGYDSDDKECPQCDGVAYMSWQDGYTYTCEECKLKLVKCICSKMFEETDDQHLYVRHPHHHRPYMSTLRPDHSILCHDCFATYGFRKSDDEYKECPQCCKVLYRQYDYHGREYYFQCSSCRVCLVECDKCKAEMEWDDDRHLFTRCVYFERTMDGLETMTYMWPMCLQCTENVKFPLLTHPRDLH